jgi:threonine dehydrogenase-like Zn-dependent dehydrogenase
MGSVLPLVQARKWPFASVITHRLPLAQGVEAYDMFERRAEGVVKIVLDPWAGAGAGAGGSA